jgi:sugar phosphate isomerase/epimerase
MTDPTVPRRGFLTTTMVGAAGVALGLPRVARAAGEPTLALSATPGSVRLGVASYSLRKFPRDKAVAMVKALGTPYINIKEVHLAYTLSPAELATARREFEAAGLQIVGGGTITFETDTDDGVRKYFEYAKAAGMPVMVSTCKPSVLPRVERFAKQYNIKVAIHNHGPEDKDFPSPYDVLKAVQGMDARMGLCMDIGHASRAGADIVKAAADARARLFDIHAKDLRDAKVKESQCIVGDGVLPIAQLFQQLQRMNYGGYVNLEYEIDADDPLPGMQRSFSYMRGVLAGLGSSAAG